jgi:hypothetical protein
MWAMVMVKQEKQKVKPKKHVLTQKAIIKATETTEPAPLNAENSKCFPLDMGQV